jgi:hypothetical protein
MVPHDHSYVPVFFVTKCPFSESRTMELVEVLIDLNWECASQHQLADQALYGCIVAADERHVAVRCVVDGHVPAHTKLCTMSE